MAASIRSERRSDDDFRGTARYEIVRRLGAGGMGVVYQAFDRERGVDVALKTLRRLDAATIYYLKQEFRSLVDVRHPNLVRLHDLALIDGEWFFTMELVEGDDFLAHVRSGALARPTETVDGPIPAPIDGSRDAFATGELPTLSVSEKLDFRRLRRALAQLVGAVHALHAAGRLHRDLKPSNVLVGHDGRLVILDFGLVTDLTSEGLRGESGSLQSADQHVLGTPEYMSPEQAACRALTPASDWYSVGVMLFEALTGGLPFLGAPLEILMAKERQDGPSPGAIVSGIPADLDRLCIDLMRRDPAARPSGSDIVRGFGGESESGTERSSSQHDSKPSANGASALSISGPSSAMPMLGRDAVMASLVEAFEATTRGRAVAVHIEGASGVGKSALLRAFVDDLGARGRALVLSGRCRERESVPYKALDPIIDGLTRHLRRLSRLHVEAVLPRDMSALTRIFPVLQRIDAIAGAARVDPPLDPKELRKRGFSALRELLARLADRRPLVLAIDDLQWADTDSVALLVDLLRAPEPPHVLLLASYRSEDIEGSATLQGLRDLQLPSQGHIGAAQRHAIVDLRASTTTLRRQRSSGCEVRRLVLGPLGRADAIDLATRLLEGDAMPAARLESNAEAIADESGGNPFLVVELVRFAHARSPADGRRRVTLEEAIAGRLADVAPSRKLLLEILAVAGQPIAPAILARAADVPDPRIDIEALADDHLVRVSPRAGHDALEPYHDRIRQVVLGTLSRDEVKGHHLRIARALEVIAPGDSEALADHFAAAGARERASLHAAKAAEEAAVALAFDRAARLYRRAIELGHADAPSTRGWRRRLGDALTNAGRGVEAAQEYLAAAGGTGGEELLDLHRRAAQQLLGAGHIDEGLSIFTVVLEAIGGKLASSPRRALASLIFRRAQLRLRGLDFVAKDASEIPLDTRVRLDTFWALMMGLCAVDTIRGADFHAQHLLASLGSGDRVNVARSLGAGGCFAALAGDGKKPRTLRMVGLARKTADESGDIYAMAIVRAADAYATYYEGNWRAAIEQLEDAGALFRDRCAGVSWELSNLDIFIFNGLLMLGRLREIGERLPRKLDEADARGDRFAQTTLRTGASCIVWIVNDDVAGGRRDILDAMSRWSQRGYHLQHYYAMSSLAQCDLYAAEGRQGLQRLRAQWGALEGSQLLRIERLRIEALFTRGRMLVAAATDPTTSDKESAALVREAERDGDALSREQARFAPPFAKLLYGAAANARHDRRAAMVHLRDACALLDSAEMTLHGAAARMALGTLLGGEEGARAVRLASAWMDGEEVVNPPRLAGTFVPGVFS